MSPWSLTPFVADEDGTAGVQRVLVATAVSMQIPPEDGRVLRVKQSADSYENGRALTEVRIAPTITFTFTTGTLKLA